MTSHHRPLRLNAPRRGGFSLIEMLIVIVIIGILAALILPAVSRAQVGVNEAATITEIKQIELAINQFKAKYGVEPPSQIIIAATPAAWANVPPQHKAILSRIWPQFRFDSGYVCPSWWANTPSAQSNNGVIGLNSGECLAFFLAGVMPTGSSGGGTGFGPASGFSSNPSTPFDPNAATRVPPFMEFDAGRFRDTDSNGFPEYVDRLPAPEKRPYLYFSSYEGQGYHVTGTDSELPTGLSIKDVYRNHNAGGLIPGNATFGFPPLKPNSFQIISPGYDGEYGSGGVFNPELPDSGLTDVNGQSDKLAFDNLTNFSSGRLRP